MTIFKGGVNGFSYFSLISVILFSNQDHPWISYPLFSPMGSGGLQHENCSPNGEHKFL